MAARLDPSGNSRDCDRLAGRANRPVIGDTRLTIPGERAVGSRAEVDFHAVAMAWRLDLSDTAEVGSLAMAESLDLGEFG